MKTKTENRLVNIIVALILFGFAIAGWFFTPLIVRSDLARLILILVSFFIPISYFLIKLIYNRNVGLLHDLAYAIVGMLVIFPFSLEFHKLSYENYYTSFTIPLFLNMSIIWHDVYTEQFKDIGMLIDTVSDYIRYFPLYLGGFLIFKLIMGNITPTWNILPIERKAFLIFKIGYYIILAITFWIIRKKFLKGIHKAIPELLLIVLLFCIYFITSIYLFLNSDYLNGSYFSYLIEIVRFIGLSTLGIYLIILLEKQKDYTGLLRKTFVTCLYIYGFLVIIPILLDLINKFTNISISFNEFLIGIITPIIGSISSGLILHFLLRKNKSM